MPRVLVDKQPLGPVTKIRFSVDASGREKSIIAIGANPTEIEFELTEASRQGLMEVFGRGPGEVSAYLTLMTDGDEERTSRRG